MDYLIELFTPLFMLIKTNLFVAIWLAGLLQIVGSAMLGLFGFSGLKITQSANVAANNTPTTFVSVNKGWAFIGRVGLALVLIGTALSSLTSMAGVTLQ